MDPGKSTQTLVNLYTGVGDWCHYDQILGYQPSYFLTSANHCHRQSLSSSGISSFFGGQVCLNLDTLCPSNKVPQHGNTYAQLLGPWWRYPVHHNTSHGCIPQSSQNAESILWRLIIGITRLCRGKKGNDISGRYALIDCRLVTKISQVEINPQSVFFREFWVRDGVKDNKENHYLDRLKAMSFIGISDETLSIWIHVSSMKRVRDKGMKYISGMKHVREMWNVYVWNM